MVLRLDEADQQAFARLSGDFNPLHLDPVVARRELLGECVVHGLHGVLRALEAAFVDRRPSGFARLEARFKQPIPVGALFTLDVAEKAGRLDLTLRTDGTASRIKATPGAAVSPDAPVGPPPPRELPLERSLIELDGTSGELAVGVDVAEVTRQFPALTAKLGPAGMADLLALTRLVGMRCPGRASVFGSFTLHFRHDPSVRGLHWVVREVDDRFARIEMQVRTRSFDGIVEAFVRPPPVTQPAFEVVRARVPSDHFADWRVLVVGGSRGLGEVMAKIVASGGGRVWVGYHRGGDDAEAVVEDIRAGGGRAEALHVDVGQPLPALPRATQVAYFAAPRIRPLRGPFQQRTYARYLEVFVHGFARVIEALPEVRWALYPSTVFVGASGRAFAEYAAAKEAGEALCIALGATNRDLVVHAPRFDRLRTDQTLALGVDPDELGDPVAALLEVLGVVQNP